MKYFLYAGLLALCCCGPSKQQVDLLVYNARIYTVDSAFSTASALAVRKGKMVDVGDTDSLLLRYTSGMLLDAAGKTIVPGLIDAHCHFLGLGLGLQQVDLKGTTSMEDVVKRLLEYRNQQHPEYIVGRGWDQNDWEDKELPTKALLDKHFPNMPVVLERVDGHALLVNQVVLDRAGIDANTPASGGEIIKKEGQLTGVLIDNPMAFVANVIPAPDRNTTVRALQEAEKACLAYGLTTVNDAGLSPQVINLIDSLQQAGKLRIRIYAMVSNNPENRALYLARGPYKTDRLNVRSFKVYADGALGSRGAVLKEPYSDQPGHYGAMVTPVDSIYQLAEILADSDFQMNTHAIGDSANAVVLRAYSKALKGRADRRWKVEHAQVVAPEELELFRNGIVPSVQPTHATSDMYWAGDRLGPGRIEEAYAYKTLLDVAGRIALGTDFPVESVSPFLTFYAAVARQDLQGYPAGGYYPQEALSRQETLRGMTIWAAWSNFEENEKGSIEKGKWADFDILSEDLMQVPKKTIPKVSAEQVFIGGIRVQ